ncbi:tetratricopeptide repeat protein [Rubellicoccus peritrichatus]|uniref:Tetratricopeptide repeat protein n=1 Tax=Rubellicoccus peritrichatus TaxID=3080537 RepID=A0AAQ3QVJ8_9BACT|nr:tetratricopeptide repeat protein [Puniceicoccus sp. CR14]WOO41688.1 tetratricopeptide repeat protein [Puniceicoccus sp. CR14]
MNRPPKKKKQHEGDLSRDPRFDQKDLEEAPDLAKQDDRNLVGVDEAFKDADVEDKVWLFWQKNGKSMIAGGVVALIAVLAVQGYRVYENKALEAMKAEYQAAEGEEATLLSFGEANASATLGAFALLESADAKYVEENYAEAGKLYAQASTGLSGTAFGARAELGQAMASIKSGDTAAGSSELTRIAGDATLIGSIRGEAAFNLVLLALQNNDFEVAKQRLVELESIEDAPIWAQQAKMMRENVPELADTPEKETPADTEATES